MVRNNTKLAKDLTDVVDGKPWYQSVTILSSLTTSIVVVAKRFGYDLENLIGTPTDWVVLLTAIISVYGRKTAKKPIGHKRHG